MDYRCRVGSLGNSSTGFWNCDHGERDGRSELQLGHRDFSFCHLCSLYIHYSLLTIFLWVIVLFHSCSSHRQVFERTNVHEFHIFYCHTECNLLSLLCNSIDNVCEWYAAKQNSTLTIQSLYLFQCRIQCKAFFSVEYNADPFLFLFQFLTYC